MVPNADVRALMPRKVGRLLEGRYAEIAFVQPFTGMDSPMNRQSPASGKTFAALWTLEGFVTNVRLSVLGQVILHAKPSSASVAYVGLCFCSVNSHLVRLERAQQCKIHQTLVAIVRLCASVNALMRMQLAHRTKTMLASLARKWLLTGVNHFVPLERAHYRESLFAEAARIGLFT